MSTTEVPVQFSGAVWRVFFIYCRNGAKGQTRPLDSKMTVAQLQLLVRDMGLLRAFGADTAAIQDLFGRHATLGSNHSMPRLDYMSFLKTMNVICQTYRVPDIWQMLASMADGQDGPQIDPGLIAMVPELLSRLQSLEELVGDRPYGLVNPVITTLETLSSGTARHDDWMKALDVRLNETQEQVAKLSKVTMALDELKRQVQETQLAHLDAQRQLDTLLSRTGTVPVLVGTPAAGKATFGLEDELRRDMRTLQEQMKIIHAQSMTQSAAQASLTNDVQRLSELKPKIEPVLTGKLQQDVADLVTEVQLVKKGTSSNAGVHDLSRRLQQQEQEWNDRMSSLEDAMAHMRACGLAPPPETATKAELAVMQDELQSKVTELSAHMEEALKRLESKYQGSNDSDGEGTSEGSRAYVSQSSLVPDRYQATANIEGKAGLVPTPPAGAPPSKIGPNLRATATSSSGAAPAEGEHQADQATHHWDPTAKPATGLLRVAEAALPPAGGSGNLSVGGVQKERKRVQFNAEAMARAEAQEIASKMSSIKEQISRGSLSSWDMERVRSAIHKLNHRVAALERLQMMVEQLNAIGECLEILDRRQKEHKQRISMIDNNMQAVLRASAAISATQQEATELLTELKMQKGALTVITDRVSNVESLVPAVRILQERINQTHDEFELRLKSYQQLSGQHFTNLAMAQQAMGLRPSMSFGRAGTAPHSIGNSSTSTPGAATSGSGLLGVPVLPPAVAGYVDRMSRRTSQPGELLNLDSPMIRSLPPSLVAKDGNGIGATGSGRLLQRSGGSSKVSEDDLSHPLAAAANQALGGSGGSGGAPAVGSGGERWGELVTPGGVQQRGRHSQKLGVTMMISPEGGLVATTSANNSPVGERSSMSRAGVARATGVLATATRLAAGGERGSAPGNM